MPLSMTRDGVSITVWTSRGSVAELTKVNNPGDVFGKLEVELTEPVFFFNRLKARVEGIGEGTKLMKDLVPFLDEHNITVVNGASPYGSMTMKQLKKFYEKYGFSDIGNDIMLRRPKQEVPQ